MTALIWKCRQIYAEKQDIGSNTPKRQVQRRNAENNHSNETESTITGPNSSMGSQICLSEPVLQTLPPFEVIDSHSNRNSSNIEVLPIRENNLPEAPSSHTDTPPPIPPKMDLDSEVEYINDCTNLDNGEQLGNSSSDNLSPPTLPFRIRSLTPPPLPVRIQSTPAEFGNRPPHDGRYENTNDFRVFKTRTANQFLHSPQIVSTQYFRSNEEANLDPTAKPLNHEFFQPSTRNARSRITKSVRYQAGTKVRSSSADAPGRINPFYLQKTPIEISPMPRLGTYQPQILSTGGLLPIVGNNLTVHVPVYYKPIPALNQ
ncbi:DgyrCDS12467 [Dimorphilus gyrociliatus]|nr:DgyrCDS12467 [Dimorphilus gyrociliatus]